MERDHLQAVKRTDRSIPNFLKAGEYTGTVNSSVHVRDILVSDTHYFVDYESNWHCHENMNMCMVFSNSMSETKRKTHYSTRMGDLFFYHSGEVHRNSIYEQVSKSINIELPLPVLKRLNLSEEQVEKNVRSCPHLKTIFLAIYKELKCQTEKEAQLTIEPYVLELISTTRENENKTPLWIKKLREYMHDHWNEPYDLKKVSNSIQVHPVTISKNFRKYFNCSFSEYRRKLMVEHSIGLVRTTDIPLSEVAYTCNFADQSHFIRTFKDHTGYLPKNVRNY